MAEAVPPVGNLGCGIAVNGFPTWPEKPRGCSVRPKLLCAIVVLWALSEPLFGFSDTWELVINTGTTIVTFLMVFLVQNTQNRDARALHLKFDELLRSVRASTTYSNLANCTDEELERIERQFQALRKREERNMTNGSRKRAI